MPASRSSTTAWICGRAIYKAHRLLVRGEACKGLGVEGRRLQHHRVDLRACVGVGVGGAWNEQCLCNKKRITEGCLQVQHHRMDLCVCAEVGEGWRMFVTWLREKRLASACPQGSPTRPGQASQGKSGTLSQRCVAGGREGQRAPAPGPLAPACAPRPAPPPTGAPASRPALGRQQWHWLVWWVDEREEQEQAAQMHAQQGQHQEEQELRAGKRQDRAKTISSGSPAPASQPAAPTCARSISFCFCISCAMRACSRSLTSLTRAPSSCSPAAAWRGVESGGGIRTAAWQHADERRRPEQQQGAVAAATQAACGSASTRPAPGQPQQRSTHPWSLAPGRRAGRGAWRRACPQRSTPAAPGGKRRRPAPRPPPCKTRNWGEGGGRVGQCSG